MLSRVAFPTGTVDIRLDASGVPQYDIRMPAAWDNIPFTTELQQLASRTRAVCFGTLARRSPVSRRTISDFVNAVPRGEGQWRILDINAYPRHQPAAAFLLPRHHFRGIGTMQHFKDQ